MKPESVRLRDGSEVVIRPIAAADKAALLRGFNSLSPDSRYRRFLTPMNTLDSRFLRYLTEVDHHDHEALVAATASDGEPVGVARYVRLASDPAAAEVAVAVVDGWQGRGAGTELLRRLERRALEEGVQRFVATCLAENREALELLEQIGPTRVEQRDPGLVELEITLPGTGPREPLRAALREAASGGLSFEPPGHD